MSTPYRCPTPCDPDCELGAWGCHEAHAYRKDHDPEACEARALADNLRTLIDTGCQVCLGRHPVPHDELEWYYAELTPRATMGSWIFHGVSPGDAIVSARRWVECAGLPANPADRATMPAKLQCAVPRHEATGPVE